MLKSQTAKIAIVLAALVIVAIVVPNTNSFLILLATRALAFAILVMSLDILLGFTGLASLGQAAYLGVGAYLTAILATRYQIGLGWDFLLVVVLGILLSGSARRGVRPAGDPRQRRLLPDDHPGARAMRLGPRLSLELAHRRRQRHQRARAAEVRRPRLRQRSDVLLRRVRSSSRLRCWRCTRWSARRSAEACSASASASCACRSSATTRGCTNTSPSSSPARSAACPACCGRTPPASSARRTWC